ncbi:PDR/VanB family oxidoreductase [Nocardioides nitrophenolicus]|uniref:PDR/VanB family oxidoreductase n=1 Tax=Nocardioides nitrophenolicus TaxID=60489 RepID=UPI00195ABE1E|nr:PDR/VanB family oxidoreductase [Nocardioides nitrophenolicus]MBM7517348.1 ferredoxin-NADP reductase [Nocardioides nitrophenolicus]
MTGEVRVRVAAARQVAERVRELVLAPVNGTPLPGWTPGAHVDVRLGPDLTRSYSLCSAPDAATWRIAVLEETDGRGGSRHVHRSVAVGDELVTSVPRNDFELVVGERPIVLVSGGIGVTPILPMAAAAQAAGAEWRLLHLARSEAAAAYVDELAAYGDRVVRHVDTDGGPVDLVATLDALGGAEADVYACGPAPLLTALEEYAAARPGARLVVERFAGDGAAVRPGDHAFVVEIADGTEIPVAADQTVLDALTGAGIRVLSSCQEGVCGTCETVVLEGEPDHRDHVLSDEERESGEMMMPCVSRCRGARIVLDL